MLRTSLFSRLDYRHCRWLAVAWMAFIFYLSSQPTVPMISHEFPGQDKFMHFVGYGILGFLLAKSFKDAHLGLTWRQVMMVGLMALAYGVSDEFHQSFVAGREASVGDLLADGLGGLAGAMLLLRRNSV